MYRIKKNSLKQKNKDDPNFAPDYNVIALKEIQKEATVQEKELQEDLEDEQKDKLEAEQRQKEKTETDQKIKNKQSLKSIAYLEDQPCKNDKKKKKKDKKLEKKLRKEKDKYYKSKVLSNPGSQKGPHAGLNKPMVVMNPRQNALELVG